MSKMSKSRYAFGNLVTPFRRGRDYISIYAAMTDSISAVKQRKPAVYLWDYVFMKKITRIPRTS